MTLQEMNNSSMLKVGTILHGTYRIDSYLSSGGFGNTYVATNIEFDERVAIKEFFMKGVTQRDDNQTTVSVSNLENNDSFLGQKEKFKKEARRIRQLKNEHIIAVHDLFEENGTAYYVMDFVDGENLSERLKHTGEPMSENEVRDILPQILDALKSVHDAGIWHLDLKPANIMLTKEGKVKLIDFGASKQLDAQKGGATTSTAISYTNGYAPREQMEQNYDKFGPWTDLYALGATLYNLLTNKRPPLPSDIDDDDSAYKHQSLPFPVGISDGMKNLVLQLMHTNRKNRPQSVSDVMPFLNQSQNESTSCIQRIDQDERMESSGNPEDNGEETIIAESVKTEPNSGSAGRIDSLENDKAKSTTNDSLPEKTACRVINFFAWPSRKISIHVVSFLATICILIETLPSLFFAYEQLDVSFPASTAIQSISSIYNLSLFLIPYLKLLLIAPLIWGLYKYGEKCVMLLVIAFAVFHFGRVWGLFSPISNVYMYRVVLYIEMLISLACGILMITRFKGYINRFGIIIVIYSLINIMVNTVESFTEISHNFDLLLGSLYVVFVYCIDLLLVYGMWWMLTRKPTSINE